MSALHQIMSSIHSLGPAEKVIVLNFLEHELANEPASDASPPSLIGLLADEPELADQISESAMKERESRPWRLPRE